MPPKRSIAAAMGKTAQHKLMACTVVVMTAMLLWLWSAPIGHVPNASPAPPPAVSDFHISPVPSAPSSNPVRHPVAGGSASAAQEYAGPTTVLGGDAVFLRAAEVVVKSRTTTRYASPITAGIALADLRRWVGAARAAELHGDGSGTAAAGTTPAVLRPRGGKDRRPSFPFVTGDGFRSVCSLVYDETTAPSLKSAPPQQDEALGTHFSSPALRPNTTVFVQTHMLDDFLATIVDGGLLSVSARPIVLVTHNSDYTSPWEPGNVRAKNGVIGTYATQVRRLLEGNPPLVSVWYAQNAVLTRHPRVVPIPIGIENRYNAFGEHLDEYAAAVLLQPPLNGSLNKPLRPMVAFNAKTNPNERGAAAAAARHASFDSTQSQDAAAVGATTARVALPKSRRGADSKVALRQFAERVRTEAAVVFAPKGHGVDTHRLWEVLYFGSVPITSPSALWGTAGSSAGGRRPGPTRLLPTEALREVGVVLVSKSDRYEDVTEPWVRACLGRLIGNAASVREASRAALSMAAWAALLHSHETAPN